MLCKFFLRCLVSCEMVKWLLFVVCIDDVIFIYVLIIIIFLFILEVLFYM